MLRHLTLDELKAGLPNILGSPGDKGVLRAIVIRTANGERRDLQSCEVSLRLEVHGDHWAKSWWKTTEEGNPHPDVQICIMNALHPAHRAGAV